MFLLYHIFVQNIHPYHSILGGDWEPEPKLDGNQNNGPDEIDSGYFERLGARTEVFLEQCFSAWGKWCANNPWLVLFIG